MEVDENGCAVRLVPFSVGLEKNQPEARVEAHSHAVDLATALGHHFGPLNEAG